jgi:hypothetical protein
MTATELEKITTTVEGYEVKALRWLPTDNVITGLVKDPETGNPRLHDGFVSGVWRKDGTPVKRIAGRTDLKLSI